MQLLCVLTALAALFLLCAFLTLRCGLHSALAPLTALGIVVCWLTAASIADLLLPGIVLLYAGCVALGVWAFVPRKTDALQQGTARLKALFSPGAVLFWGMALGFAIYFFVRAPLAHDYDEMSLWATAVKLTKVDNRLYATATLGTPWAATQNPGLPLLAYFFQFFGEFADWKTYLAYDVLAFAVFAAVLGAVRWRQWMLAAPLAAACWVTPYFFTVYNHTIYLDNNYLTSYGDVPAGLVFGGAVALWLMLRRSGGPRWAVLPVLALAANIKANTFVIALVAAGLVAVDAWLFGSDGAFRKGLLRRTGFAAACFAAPMAVYYFWNVRYVGALVAKNAAEGGTGETSLPLSGVVLNGIKMLLGGQGAPEYEARRDQFTTAIADMGQQYFTSAGRMSMVGQGLLITLFILGVFAAAVVLAPTLALRLRTALAAVLSLICFGGYNLMLGLSYGFIFKPFQAQALTDYNRYIGSYYIGWFLLALACLSLVAQQADCSKPALRPLLGRGALLALAALMLWRWDGMVLPQLSVLGFSDSEFADRRTSAAEAVLVSSYLQPEDRLFFVSQGDTGYAWFSAVYDFYPILVDYSGIYDPNDTSMQLGGGGTFGLAELQPEEDGPRKVYYHPYSAEFFEQTVRESGCSYLYIQKLDDIFVQSYAQLFTDGLATALAGETLLYQVTDAGFTPVAMSLQEVGA